MVVATWFSRCQHCIYTVSAGRLVDLCLACRTGCARRWRQSFTTRWSPTQHGCLSRRCSFTLDSLFPFSRNPTRSAPTTSLAGVKSLTSTRTHRASHMHSLSRLTYNALICLTRTHARTHARPSLPLIASFFFLSEFTLKLELLQGRTGSSDRPWLIRQNGPMNSGVIRKSGKKEKSNYFIVRPKVDQRAGLLSLPHLGFLPFTRANFLFALF